MKYYKYFSTGFLSLQTALNQQVLGDYVSGTPPLAAPIPFPVAAYSHNLFFNFAGNLIGKGVGLDP